MYIKAVLQQTCSGAFCSQFAGVAMTTDDIDQQVSEEQCKHAVQVAAVWLGHQQYMQSVMYGNAMEQHDQQHVEHLESTCPTITSYTIR